MDQIESIFGERNADILLLKELIDKHNRKLEFLDRERNRIQRQNWIMKVIKSINHLNTQYRKMIYDVMHRMMKYFLPQLQDSLSNQAFENQHNFIEQLINLFVKFFSECPIGQTNGLKKVIRPNNNKIIIDMIKFFLDAHRNYFRNIMMEVFSQPFIERKKHSSRSLQLKKQTIPTSSETNEDGEKKSKREEILTLGEKISYLNFQKYTKFAQDFNENDIRDRINQTYLQLLDRNQQNNYQLRRFQEECCGKPKNIQYNYSGLYTNKQLKMMEEKREKQWKNQVDGFQQLKGQCSPQHLKEYFKIKIQIEGKKDKIQSRKVNKKRVSGWLPIVIQRINKQQYPLTMMIEYQRQIYSFKQLWEKFRINAKALIQTSAKETQPFKKDMVKDSEIRSFRKHLYLDFNRLRTKQLLQNSTCNYQREKKELILPILKKVQKKAQTEGMQKSRSMSECKLAPLYPDYLALKFQNRREEKVQEKNYFQKLKKDKNTHKSAQVVTEQEHQKPQRLSNDLPSGRSKIDSIIESIISQRNLTTNI